MKKQNKSERGQVLVLIALGIVGMIGMIGLTIDGGLAYSDRRHAQNAADTSALAAGRSKIRGEAWVAAGEALAEANGYDNNGTTNTVEIIFPPDHRSVYEGDDQYIQVVITSHVQTTFARVVGITEMTNIVQAVARVVPPTDVNMFEGNAIVSLNPDECKAFKYGGNADTVITGGGIYVNSDCPSSAFFSNSAANELTAPSLCSVGGIDINDSHPETINIPSMVNGEENCEPYDYPIAEYIMPLPDCGAPGVATEISPNHFTLTPGDYSDSTFPPPHVGGDMFLEPGIYCIEGNFRLNAQDVLVGSDVVFYMSNGDVQWNGQAEVDLDAPNEGPFAGLLIYLPYENNSTVLINGGSDALSGNGLVGTILAPASDIQINGGGEAGINGQIIGNTVDISGGSGTNITYTASENYQAETAPNLQLVE